MGGSEGGGGTTTCAACCSILRFNYMIVFFLTIFTARRVVRVEPYTYIFFHNTIRSSFYCIHSSYAFFVETICV